MFSFQCTKYDENRTQNIYHAQQSQTVYRENILGPIFCYLKCKCKILIHEQLVLSKVIEETKKLRGATQRQSTRWMWSTQSVFVLLIAKAMGFNLLTGLCIKGFSLLFGLESHQHHFHSFTM